VATRPTDKQLVARMSETGIVHPDLALKAAREAKLPVPVACALLEQESEGGANVWGHDKDAKGNLIFPARPGTVAVTEPDYREYKRRRGPKGEGGMQGCGPTQLTWWALQDEADKLGGCWKPYPNMLVGFTHLASLIRRNGLRIGFRAYNGSGAKAERYADQMLAKVEKWEQRLKVPVEPKPKKVVVNPRDWWKRFVFGDTDCRRELLTRLANVAKDYGQGARIYVASGKRTRREQEILYALYRSGKGPLAARPGTSNHEPRPPDMQGEAADCHLVYRNGVRVNIGSDDRARQLMRKRGLCLPVPGETWHVEIGNRWRA
jgi:hypothetical protein